MAAMSGRRMNPQELSVRRLPRGNAAAPRHEAVVAQPPPDGGQSARMLRVVVGSAVGEKALVVDETRGHGVSIALESEAASETGARQEKFEQT